MIDILKNICFETPKGINEFVFVCGITEIIVLCWDKTLKRKKDCFFLFFVILFMVLWRARIGEIRVLSSRYFSILIIPFIIFSADLFSKGIKNIHSIVKILSGVLFCVMLFLFLQADTKRYMWNLNYYYIAEIIHRLPRSYHCVSMSKEYYRLSFLSKEQDKIEVNDSSFYYNNNYGKRFYPDIVDIENYGSNREGSPPRHKIGSFINHKSSRIDLFHTKPTIKVGIISENRTYADNPNLLANGNAEALDSPEESVKKVRTHIPDYLTSHEEANLRTAENSQFQKSYCVPNLIGIDFEFPIEGKSSIIIDGSAYFFFKDKIYSNGSYRYSIQIRGRKGTKVQLLCTNFRNTKSYLNRLCLFIIPDSLTYKIETDFTIDDFQERDYFIVGAYVDEGQADLDCFHLSKE